MRHYSHCMRSVAKIQELRRFSAHLFELAVACVSAACTRENVVARQENRAKIARFLIFTRYISVWSEADNPGLSYLMYTCFFFV